MEWLRRGCRGPCHAGLPVLGLTPRTLRGLRAFAGGGLVDRRTWTPRVPPNRLSPEEQEAILTVSNEPEYCSLATPQGQVACRVP